MKLFEIPVYALSRECLGKRVKHEFDIYKSSYPDSTDIIEVIKTGFNLRTFPARLWEFNHIIGYIVVNKDDKDINIKWYTSSPELKRYSWKSEKKHFLQEISISGNHFYIGNLKNGEELEKKIKNKLEEFVKFLKPNYYADLEAFKNINAFIDYDKLLKGVK